MGGGGGGVGGQPVGAMGVVGPGGLVDRSLSVDAGSADPPPLPPKKKHIMSYMEMFGQIIEDFKQHYVCISRTALYEDPLYPIFGN